MRALSFRSGLALPALIMAMAAMALPAPPPKAPVDTVVTDYYGTKVPDPYRWMEGQKNPKRAAWMKAQADYTSAVLASIPGRDALLREIEKADGADTTVEQVRPTHGSYFYLKSLPGQNLPTLNVRVGVHGAERILVDPNTLSKGASHYSISYFRPSFDGRYVAFGLAGNGSEKSVLHVLDVKTGKTLDDTITRIDGDFGFSPIAWRHDNKSFFYYRQQKLGPDDPPTAKYLKSRDYLHRLGVNPHGDGDKPVFGFEVNRDIKVAPDQDALIATSSQSPYVFAMLTRNENTSVIESIYAAPMKDVGVKPDPWHRITTRADKVGGFTAHGDNIYIVSHKDAPHFKVVKTSVSHPDIENARVVVPNGEAVVIDAAAGDKALYVITMNNSVNTVKRYPYDGSKPEEVPLPYAGTIAGGAIEPGSPGIFLALTSWTRSPLWYHYDPSKNQVTDTKWVPPSRVDFSQIESREVEAVSYDGTRVPLSIIMPKGTKLDGKNPVLLIGYGAYGITIRPGFMPVFLPWYQRGGIVAIGHIRGGGAKGEDWHQAGMKGTKINTILDFIACAHYLIDNHYTSPAYLAGNGGSAGGIAVGGAITWRPDLFAAAIDNVGLTDTLRMELTPNGPPNIVEFGSVKTPKGFHALYAMSAYAHVHDGARYPAVLLTTGANDPRVAPWIVAKMAARLQAATASDKPVLLRVDYDAGHGIGSTRLQYDKRIADQLSFLLWQFGVKGFQPAN